MNSNFDVKNMDDGSASSKPEFLKVLCILSFAWSAIAIIFFFLGSFAMGVNEQNIDLIMSQAIAQNPGFSLENPLEFFNTIGTVSLYSMFTNILSLVGAIMMWNMKRTGFYVYLTAELLPYLILAIFNPSIYQSNFLGFLIFVLVIDMAFIMMYSNNLKHFPSHSSNNGIQ
jgi:hypothetical protein